MLCKYAYTQRALVFKVAMSYGCSDYQIYVLCEKIVLLHSPINAIITIIKSALNVNVPTC